MDKVNIFCFGFGQVAKNFINKLKSNKVNFNLSSTTREQTNELDVFTYFSMYTDTR